METGGELTLKCVQGTLNTRHFSASRNLIYNSVIFSIFLVISSLFQKMMKKKSI